MLPEEFQHIAEWTSTKITMQLGQIEFAHTVMGYMAAQCIPQSFTLTRNGDRI
jgi:hypothetical protein